MDSNVGLAIQCVGIVLVTLLSFLTMRSVETPSQRYWTIAWVCLSLSLSSLIVAFHTPPPLRNIFYSFYFFGEYAFGYMFAAGCRHQATGRRLTKQHLYALAPGIGVAATLPLMSDDFNNLFVVQAAIMAVLFAAAFNALRPALGRGGLGLRVMGVALILLSLDFLHYVPVFGIREGAWDISVPQAYLKYTYVINLIIEILLGFGTVMVSLEGVRREVEETNRELTRARDQLEVLARVDPLTDALNRHAFHSLRSRRTNGTECAAAGCVAVVDLNDLKLINDSHGHAAGDKAIRAVANAIHSIVRADDLLFRWGGDEFLVLLFGIGEQDARLRLDTLDERLERAELPWMSANVSVSHGLACFDTLAHLDQAIERADAEMYKRKLARKAMAEEVVEQVA